MIEDMRRERYVCQKLNALKKSPYSLQTYSEDIRTPPCDWIGWQHLPPTGTSTSCTVWLNGNGMALSITPYHTTRTNRSICYVHWCICTDVYALTYLHWCISTNVYAHTELHASYASSMITVWISSTSWTGSDARLPLHRKLADSVVEYTYLCYHCYPVWLYLYSGALHHACKPAPVCQDRLGSNLKLTRSLLPRRCSLIVMINDYTSIN
jgi:hypothetical protein